MISANKIFSNLIQFESGWEETNLRIQFPSTLKVSLAVTCKWNSLATTLTFDLFSHQSSSHIKCHEKFAKTHYHSCKILQLRLIADMLT